MPNPILRLQKPATTELPQPLRREVVIRFGAMVPIALLGLSRGAFALLQKASPQMAEPKNVANSNETKIKSIIVEQLQVDEKQLVREAKLIDDLGADSLDIVELCMQFEEAFDLTIPDADVCKWRTVGNVIDYLLDRIQRSSRKTSALSSHRNEPGAGASSTQPGTRVDESIALGSTSESNPYVITGACMKHLNCVDACPVDCIHPQTNESTFTNVTQLYIDPFDCIECGACLSTCSVNAISPANQLPDKWKQWQKRNVDFFTHHGPAGM